MTQNIARLVAYLFVVVIGGIATTWLFTLAPGLGMMVLAAYLLLAILLMCDPALCRVPYWHKLLAFVATFILLIWINDWVPKTGIFLACFAMDLSDPDRNRRRREFWESLRNSSRSH